MTNQLSSLETAFAARKKMSVREKMLGGWPSDEFKPCHHRLDLHGAYLPKTSLKGTILCDAKLQGADFSGADLSNTNLKGANLDGTNLSGADLTGARNLTIPQVSRAILDGNTKLPDYIDRDILLSSK